MSDEPAHDEQPTIGYMYTPAQAQALRVRFVEQELLPAVREVFEAHPVIASACLYVAQYWDDQASDAVHAVVLFSESPEPRVPEVGDTWSWEFYAVNLPSFASAADEYGQGVPQLAWNRLRWDDSQSAIPLWAPFTVEGGDQSADFAASYSPAVQLKRDGSYQFHDMVRPWLDGIRPSWADF